MLEIASEITLCLMLAAIIGFAIGFLTCKVKAQTNTKATKTEEQPAPIITQEKVQEKVQEEVQENKPQAKETKKDDLTQLKGVGPKLAEKLYDIEIYSFEQISNWTDENFEWLEENTTFASRAKKDDWVTQAKALLAK